MPHPIHTMVHNTVTLATTKPQWDLGTEVRSGVLIQTRVTENILFQEKHRVPDPVTPISIQTTVFSAQTHGTHCAHYSLGPRDNQRRHRQKRFALPEAEQLSREPHTGCGNGYIALEGRTGQTSQDPGIPPPRTAPRSTQACARAGVDGDDSTGLFETSKDENVCQYQNAYITHSSHIKKYYTADRVISLLSNGKNKSIIIYNTQYFPHLHRKEKEHNLI